MDADKQDIDKISEEKTREKIKTNFQELVHSVDKSINLAKYFPERIEKLKYKEVWEVFNKQLAWFFAISVGTLLWIFNNFDKFKLSDGSMPYKYLYIFSIILLASSSLLLAGIQGISFWYQHKIIKYSNNLVINLNSYIRRLNDFQNDLDNSFKLFDSYSLQESLNLLRKSSDSLENFVVSFEDINKLFGEFEKSFNESFNIIFSEYSLIPPVIIYMLGVISILIYISSFMIKYVK